MNSAKDLRMEAQTLIQIINDQEDHLKLADYKQSDVEHILANNQEKRRLIKLLVKNFL